VGINEGGVRETIQDDLNGILLPDCRPEPLGKAISSYTSNLEYAELMGKRARDYVVEKWPLLESQGRLEAEILSLA
jgi:glycosyltransferase involved in cell wall biosynthesis